MSTKKILSGIVISIIVVSAAYVAGTEARNYFQTKKVQEAREKISKSPVMKLNDLKVGDKLPDGIFDDLSFQSTTLAEYVNGKTIITFMSPTCNSCLEDIEFIYENVPNSNYYNKFVYISYGNPRLLLDIKNEYNVQSPILYDHNAKYSSQFDVTIFPLHMLVDENLTVLDIYAGSITENDIEKVL